MVRGSGRRYPGRTSRLGNLPYRCVAAPLYSRRPVPRWVIGTARPRVDDPGMLDQRREHFPGITMRSLALAGLALVGIGWLAIGLVTGWVVFFTPLLERAVSVTSRSPAAPLLGAAAWALALTAPTCFLVLGVVRVAGVATHLLGRTGPRRPVHAMARALPAGVESLPTIHLPDGRRIPDVVLGPHGIAFFEPLPPAAAARQIGGRWEVRFGDGRWRPIEHPLDRAARDADGLRRFLAEDDRDFVVKVHPVVTSSAPQVERTDTCAVVALADVPGWIAALSAQRSLSQARLEHVREVLKQIS